MVLLWKPKVWLFVILCSVGLSMQSWAEPFSLVGEEGVATLFVDESDATVVHKSAAMLASDVAAISGHKLSLASHFSPVPHTAIIAGTLGQSALIDSLIEQGDIDPSSIQGQWERYQIWLKPVAILGDKPALVVVGSDRRGTAYGLLSLSRQMGVSPWEWWADVTPATQYPLSVDVKTSASSSPDVKYRGIFLNDEDWGLQIWAAKNYEPETGDIGPKTYARVFELLLRLRANTIWPAMHKTTTPFYAIPENKQVADDYGIVVGTSHAEPMLSNINGEWDKDAMGQYRYDTNAGAVKQFFSHRIRETKDFESIYTVAMRGEHDSPMIMRDSSMADQVALLDKVITDQRKLLSSITGENVDSIPQAFVPYKEVLTYYQNGLEVPDDITLMWTDDNYGYLRQLSNPEEQKRSGGAGIYYHTSYWGRPHDYLWLNSTNPILMWQEITKAWDLHAREQWILNVGDIKPHEYNTELFMDIAWQRDQFNSADDVYSQMAGYFARDLSAGASDKLVAIFKQYFHLVYQRRPEFMAWSHVEPVSLPQPGELTQTHYGDEVSALITQWQALIEEVETLQPQIDKTRQDAFYQLAYYPIVAAGNMSLKWLYHYKNAFAAAQGRGDANWYAEQMASSYQTIQDITRYYNTEVANGKWQHIMSASPRNLPVFDMPPSAQPHRQQKQAMGFVLEGFDMPANSYITNSHARTLPVFNSFTRKPRFIDIYLNGDQAREWSISPQQPWIKLSKSQGRLSQTHPHERVWVDIDWGKVPEGEALKEPPLGHDHQLIPPSFKVPGKLIFTTEDFQSDISLNVFNPDLPELKSYDGYVEDLGYVVLDAANFQRQKNGENRRWQKVDNLGYSGSVMKAVPVTADPESADLLSLESPALEYDFYTFNQGMAEISVNVVPTHPMYEGRGVRVAVVVDDNNPEILDFRTQGRSETWKQNVLKNQARGSIQQLIDKPGKHTLAIYMVDSGILVDSILIDLGGKKASYALPAATVNKAFGNR